MLESVFPYITFRALSAALTSLLLSLAFGKTFIKFLTRNGMGQRVSKWEPSTHRSKEGTPTSGGVFIFLVVILSCLLWSSLSNKYFLTAVLCFSLFAFIGIIDDFLKRKSPKRGFSILQKLILQILASSLVSYIVVWKLSHPVSLTIPFSQYVIEIPQIVYFLLLVFMMTGASNAVNLTDGLDGLAISHILIALSVLFFLVYVSGHRIFAGYFNVFFISGAGELSVFIGALLGACLGFLWFNTYPAEVFLGDSGSLSLGAFIGIAAIMSKTELFLPIFGGIFVIEAVSVLLQVFSFRLTGKRLIKMAPIHHHFELSGWPEPKVTVRFIIISVILAAISLLGVRLR